MLLFHVPERRWAASCLLVACTLVLAPPLTRLGAATADSDDSLDPAAEEHWSFRTPERPVLPELDRGRTAWLREGLDHFVAARHAEENLRPAPELTRRGYIRRLSLDLRGLPPRPEEVARYLADGRPGAAERLVDRLLADPAYGERMARPWLDLARYADSQGYEKDNHRVMWRWRDWVIEAFNRDLSFDRFTLEQLAGDLLPGADPEALLATAFHRNTLTNTEGGTDDEEFRDLAVKDRTDTTVQVWMGLTMGCAKCHSHKYDPLSQEDYYRFYAFFNQTEDRDRGDDEPKVEFPTAEESRRRAAIDRELAKLRAEIEVTKGSAQEAAGSAEAKTGLAALEERRKALEAERKTIRSARIPILRELAPDKQRKTRVHRRGSFLDPQAEVRPDTPAAFHPFDESWPRDRRGVAAWLTARQNPLTARVLANRLWALFFGRGLVETEEDWGTQGQEPSHPELLDWLALELQDGGWSIKSFVRTIVLSATYRQSARVSPALARRDPENRLLARGPRFRLEAEALRDASLAVAGLLSRKQGGPSVMPYQPEGIWQATYSATPWVTSPGEDCFRRGLYTYVRRTSPYPSAQAFDAPSREFCLIRRIRTNTPLQALVTLNDPVYVEAARALARLLLESRDTLDGRLELLYERALSRPVEPEERSALAGLLRRRLAHYASAPAAQARAFAGFREDAPLPEGVSAEDVPAIAAWTLVAQTVLNLDEFLTRG